MASRKRSPLKANPLRVPGQSLETRRGDLFDNRILVPLLVAGLLTLLAVVEWLRTIFPMPPLPWLWTGIAVIGVVFAAYRIIRFIPEARALKLAIHGERAVGQFLDDMRQDGYKVFHDLLGSGFNVDHVLIGPSGVFTIETKTHSKRSGPDPKVTFDGRTIVVDGWEPDRDPVVQAKAQAKWLRGILADTTGRKFDVWPVVLFPGWFVEQRPGSTKEMWVLNPKAFKVYLENEQAVLSPEDVNLVSFHLSRYIRTTSDNRQ
jgi:hypothetical protein